MQPDSSISSLSGSPFDPFDVAPITFMPGRALSSCAVASAPLSLPPELLRWKSMKHTSTFKLAASLTPSSPVDAVITSQWLGQTVDSTEAMALRHTAESSTIITTMLPLPEGCPGAAWGTASLETELLLLPLLLLSDPASPKSAIEISSAFGGGLPQTSRQPASMSISTSRLPYDEAVMPTTTVAGHNFSSWKMLSQPVNLPPDPCMF
mmetsp:Transcript_10818/g.25153  ORF Transcript_10818/g.25153 Transcript_10818/m.25153 type:complete len:208 (+) Transcript_10818:1028-1651(+)